MTDQEIGLWGGILGSALGLAGGVFGAWMSLRSAKPGPERMHLARWTAIIGALTIGFTVAMLLVPAPWRMLLWVPYAPLLMLSLRAVNRGQPRIRAETR